MSLAVQIRQHGIPKNSRLLTYPWGAGPRRDPHRHHAVGLNFIDVYHRTGLYPLNMPRPSAWKPLAWWKLWVKA